LAADKSTYLRNLVLDSVFNSATLDVTTPYISLHSGDPGLTGANEITAGANAYARQSGSFGAAASGAITNDAQIQWTNLPSVTVTYGGVWDALTTGNFLYRFALSSSQVVNAGGTLTIAVGDCDFTET
jgi:hypothetical protein